MRTAPSAQGFSTYRCLQRKIIEIPINTSLDQPSPAQSSPEPGPVKTGQTGLWGGGPGDVTAPAETQRISQLFSKLPARLTSQATITTITVPR